MVQITDIKQILGYDVLPYLTKIAERVKEFHSPKKDVLQSILRDKHFHVSRSAGKVSVISRHQ